MSQEAIRLALNKAFQLGQRYWSWADSEYSSHWKKANAAKAEFDQLMQDTINAALAEREAVLPGGGHVPAVPVAVYGYCPECGGAGVMRERRPNGDDKCTNGHKYPSSQALAEQPAQQEPFEYWNAVEGWVKIDEVRQHFDSVGCGTIYKTPGDGRVPLTTAQRTWVGLTDEEIDELFEDGLGFEKPRAIYREIEDKLKEKNT